MFYISYFKAKKCTFLLEEAGLNHLLRTISESKGSHLSGSYLLAEASSHLKLPLFFGNILQFLSRSVQSLVGEIGRPVGGEEAEYNVSGDQQQSVDGEYNSPFGQRVVRAEDVDQQRFDE